MMQPICHMPAQNRLHKEEGIIMGSRGGLEVNLNCNFRGFEVQINNFQSQVQGWE